MNYFFIFVFGAIIGSFLNVVILRYNTGESIVKGGSRCFSCNKKLKWYELIPIFSFIAQKGKCRDCHSKISFQYPIVEFLTGLIFLLTFLKFQITDYWLLTTGYFFIIFSLLIIIAVYDFRHQIIPNGFVYSFIFLSFFYLILKNWDLFRNLKLEIRNFDLWSHVLAGILFFSFFVLLWLVSKGNWMGFGDAKLALGMGWFLGLEKGVLAMLVSFWTGAIVGIFLLFFSANKRYNIKSKIAFGPFLVLGAAVAFFAGDWLIKLLGIKLI